MITLCASSVLAGLILLLVMVICGMLSAKRADEDMARMAQEELDSKHLRGM